MIDDPAMVDHQYTGCPLQEPVWNRTSCKLYLLLHYKSPRQDLFTDSTKTRV